MTGPLHTYTDCGEGVADLQARVRELEEVLTRAHRGHCTPCEKDPVNGSRGGRNV